MHCPAPGMPTSVLSKKDISVKKLKVSSVSNMLRLIMSNNMF